jgi:hypothetical protein
MINFSKYDKYEKQKGKIIHNVNEKYDSIKNKEFINYYARELISL